MLPKEKSKTTTKKVVSAHNKLFWIDQNKLVQKWYSIQTKTNPTQLNLNISQLVCVVEKLVNQKKNKIKKGIRFSKYKSYLDSSLENMFFFVLFTNQ